jgi:hypothetical protein
VCEAADMRVFLRLSVSEWCDCVGGWCGGAAYKWNMARHNGAHHQVQLAQKQVRNATHARFQKLSLAEFDGPGTGG